MRITNQNQAASDPRVVQPTNPYHLSRAYGVQAPAAISPVTGARPDRLPSGAERLVAGVVPGGVDFGAGGIGDAKPSGAALPMYRHPADKNAAATAVNIGRRLDVQG